MARTWKRLAGPALVTNAVVTKYTCPALTKAIIRHIHVQNNSGSDVTFTLSIGTDAAGTRIFDAYPISAHGILDHYPIYTVDAAEIVQAVAGTTNVLTLTINGEELTLG
jgi:hypothetical protein